MSDQIKLKVLIGEPRKGVRVDWRRAFVALTLLVTRGWVNSDQFSMYVDRMRDLCGDEPADLMVELFNSTRPKAMQDFMG